MSLMNAGVPIKRPVSGVAMGLVKEGDAYTILTDIQGMEDALGDMDFKAAQPQASLQTLYCASRRSSFSTATRDCSQSFTSLYKEGQQ